MSVRGLTLRTEPLEYSSTNTKIYVAMVPTKTDDVLKNTLQYRLEMVAV